MLNVCFVLQLSNIEYNKTHSNINNIKYVLRLAAQYRNASDAPDMSLKLIYIHNQDNWMSMHNGFVSDLDIPASLSSSQRIETRL